ncbi:MAG: hypothetical protein ACFB0B_04815 [Thermonemataceae bacterium]
MILKRCVFVVYFLGSCFVASAQVDSTRIQPRVPSNIKGGDNQKTQKFYSEVEDFFEGKKILAPLYEWLFVNDEDRSDSLFLDQPRYLTSADSVSFYNGKKIRTIRFKQLSVFGASLQDTAGRKLDKAEKVGDFLHINTRLWKLESLLLVKEGDQVNVELIRDNERLFRQTPQILDARFLLLPVKEDTSLVDMLVVVQDNWSLQAEIIPNGLSLSERNFLGIHHEITNAVSYNSAEDFVAYTGRYRINNIYKIFLNFDFTFQRSVEGNTYLASLERTFFAPSVKYAGRIAYTYAEQRPGLYSYLGDTLRFISNVFQEEDVWLGRAFRIINDRTNLTFGARYLNRDFLEKPEVSERQNQFFHDRQLFLFNLTFSSRIYYREALIYAFGRTEDVPQGGNVVLTYGIDNYEFGQRNFYAFEAAYGKTFKRFGYWSNLISVGGFRNQSNWEQVELRWQSSYFSDLEIGERIGYRQFANIDFRKGVNRFDNETLSYDFDNLTYLTPRRGFGTQQISLELEEVFFKPWNIIGFRTAFFFNALGAFWSREGQSLFQNGLFQAYSVGIRLRNERISFNNLTFRFTFYPRSNYNTLLFSPSFGNASPTQFKDFDAKAPTTTFWDRIE